MNKKSIGIIVDMANGIVFTPYQNAQNDPGCGICFNPNDGNSISHAANATFHAYHRNCLLQWVNQQQVNHVPPTCPICVQRIDVQASFQEGTLERILRAVKACAPSKESFFMVPGIALPFSIGNSLITLILGYGLPYTEDSLLDRLSKMGAITTSEGNLLQKIIGFPKLVLENYLGILKHPVGLACDVLVPAISCAINTYRYFNP